MRMASMRGRGGSALMRCGVSPNSTHQNFFCGDQVAESGSMEIVIFTHLPSPAMTDSVADRRRVTQSTLRLQPPTENDQGSMNLASIPAWNGRMLDVALNVSDAAAGRALEQRRAHRSITTHGLTVAIPTDVTVGNYA